MKKLLVIIFTLLTVSAHSQIFMTEDDMNDFRIGQSDYIPPTPLFGGDDDYYRDNNYVDLSTGVCCLLMFAGVYERSKRTNKKERK